MYGTTQASSQCVQVCSCIVFMTDGGGPTLVIDQGPEDVIGEMGWLAQPKGGRIFAFPGCLLHGVIPRESLRHGRTSTVVLVFGCVIVRDHTSSANVTHYVVALK